MKNYAKNNSCLFLRDGSGSVWSAYKHINSIPLNYVLEVDHTVHAHRTGFSETEMRTWIDECLAGIEEGKEVKVEKLELKVCPNLFRDKTVISYSIPVDCNDLQLTVYDLSGRLVRTFPIHNSRGTTHEITWDGKDSNEMPVQSGVYFCKLNTKKVSLIEKVIVTR